MENITLTRPETIVKATPIPEPQPEPQTPVDRLYTTLETELMVYGLLAAADVQGGKVVDLEVFILSKSKKKLRSQFLKFSQS